MSLFKSREERRIERTMQVRRAVSHIRKQIKDNEKYEQDYISKAKRARRLGWGNQYEFLKKAIKKTATIKVRLERQQLALESALQIKEQAEGHSEFASAMGALSKSIAEVFGSVDMAKTQVNFEKAMAQADSLEERMDTFLEMTSESMFGYEGSSEAELVSDNDIEKMLAEEVEHDERAGGKAGDGDAGARARIDEDIAAIEKAIDESRK
jgi:hypothetical protein